MVSKIFYFHPLPGEMIQIDKYFSSGLKPPTSYGGVKQSWVRWFFLVGDTLPETNISPEGRALEGKDRINYQPSIFRGFWLLVLGRVYFWKLKGLSFELEVP